MDPVITTFPSVAFDELNLCLNDGVAYQRDMTTPVSYDQAYFDKYVGYENTDIAKGLNDFRCRITKKYCGDGATVLDVGIGSGEFMANSNLNMLGYDINPVAVEKLKSEGRYCDPYDGRPNHVQGFTFWDSLEHIPKPSLLLAKLPPGSHVFVSIPVFRNLLDIKQSKHYKPNEHFYYYTPQGLIDYVDCLGFKPLEISEDEVKAGREHILSFVFFKKRDAWTFL